MSEPLSEILVRQFGIASEAASRFLACNRDPDALREYYLAVVSGLQTHWFGEGAGFFAMHEGEHSGTHGAGVAPECFVRTPFPREIADHFGPLYQNLVPAGLRRALGEFYTPDWLADRLLRQCLRETHVSASESTVPIRVLDPACGSGVFLLATVKTLHERGVPLSEIVPAVTGFDLNPAAVATANLNLRCAFSCLQNSAKGSSDSVRCDDTDHSGIDSYHERVHRFDSLFGCLSDQDDTFPPCRLRYSVVLGNPPWNHWDRFSLPQRERLRPLWEKYGFFNLSANKARGGGAKKEFAALMLLACADRYLECHGRIAMVVPQSLFQTLDAGSGFRRFEIAPGGTPLRVIRVDDFSAFPVFSGVSAKTATVVLEKGIATSYPVPYFLWSGKERHVCRKASPMLAGKNDSPWKIGAFDRTDGCDFEPGQSDYKAFLGANTGGANGIFWLEILEDRGNGLVLARNCPTLGKKTIAATTVELESELIYPLLRWKQIDRNQIQTPSLGILLPQDVRKRIGLDEHLMKTRYPNAYDYLKRFETELRARAAYRKYLAGAPFYSLYNVAEPTLAPIKVVWRRMDTKFRAAIVETCDHPLLGRRPIVPQETTVIVPCTSREEACYLLDILNSPRIAEKIASFGATGTKGFGSPGILNYLGIRKFSGSDVP